MRINRRIVTLTLSLLGVVGVGGTAVVAVKCHDKVKDEPDKKKKLLGYAPAIATGVATGACIMGSHYISAKEIAALTASCAYLAGNRDKIMTKVREKYGDEAAKEIQKEAVIEKPEVELVEGDEIILTSKKGGTQRFVDFYLGREFYSTLEQVEQAEKDLNWMFHNGEYVSMNDFYQLLGLPYTRAGDDFGWPANEDYYCYDCDEPIMFENVRVEDERTGEPLYLIDIRTPPVNYWMEV